MSLVIDASMAVAWHVSRNDPSEAGIAQQAIHTVMTQGALIPGLWFVEVANALLTAERRQVSDRQATTQFLADLDALPITPDSRAPGTLRTDILTLARRHDLTAYDASYIELALRAHVPLATFDRKLANACRQAGGHVFGDIP
jgi:predicted nucleic acid-binding protein